mmetsp:Transcript_30448/g.68694  ORF Transcript_30448/g.68694 Transcript_30448/m.68694 type:complete len:631 (-) Transcript_30448:148-2040(-)
MNALVALGRVFSRRRCAAASAASPPASLATLSSSSASRTPRVHVSNAGVWNLPSPSHANHFNFSAVAQQDWEDDGDNAEILPIRHSSKLPPLVCASSQLQREVESIFDSTVGTLIVYPNVEGAQDIKSATEEIEDAYFASDAIVQRIEYIMRGLNAHISKNSYVSRSVSRGRMKLDIDVGSDGGMETGQCFSAMLDLVERMKEEGQVYADLRTRVRSQLANPASETIEEDKDKADDKADHGEASDEMDKKDETKFDTWRTSMNENMAERGFPSNPTTDSGYDDGQTISDDDYQFGATPGVTVHMIDMLLDGLACLCEELYITKTSSADLADLFEDKSPPELAKEMLDLALDRHCMDGGNIGLGGGGPFDTIAQGIGTGAGTGAGNLANLMPSGDTIDARTCPTPLTFNGVLRVAANFDPLGHAEAVESAKVLSGSMGNDSSSGKGSSLEQEKQRLRDVTIDAAFSSYDRMKNCAALTLRSIRGMNNNATSREAMKRQAKLLAAGSTANMKDKHKSIVSGRNSATYAYLIETVGRNLDASLSRGNIAWGLYTKGAIQEGVLDERLLRALGSIGGYDNSCSGPPPVSNGPLFDSYLEKELGNGVESALEKGRRESWDRNYKMRRHADWDDAY